MAEKLTISAFSQLAECSRQNIHSLVKKGELIKDDDGKMDPVNPINAEYLAARKIGKRKITNRGGKVPGNNPPEIKKTVKKKESENKIKTEKKQEKKKTVISFPQTTPEDTDEEKERRREEATKRAIEKSKLELEKLKEDVETRRLKNEKERGKLCEVDTLGKTLIGYVIALNKTLLDQPRSFVDEFESAIKMGKSKTELTDIIRKPASSAIMETKDIIKKEIQKFKRAVVEAEKRRKAMEEIMLDE